MPKILITVNSILDYSLHVYENKRLFNDMEHEDQDTGNASNIACNRGSKTFLTQRYQVIIKLGFNRLTIGFHCKADDPTKSRRTCTYLITLFSSFRSFQLGLTRTLADILEVLTSLKTVK